MAYYENFPTKQMVEEAGEQQLVLWMAMLPIPKNDEEGALLDRITTRLGEFDLD